MNGPDFERAKELILDRLERELPARLHYHSVDHTRGDVLPAVERLASLEGIDDEEELLLLRTAALYHDAGFLEKEAGHEAISARMAAETLPAFGYRPAQVERICQLIQATVMPQDPKTNLEMILADADLDVLGREDFLERSLQLRQEFFAKGEDIPLDKWYSEQLAFLQGHCYFTEAAQMLRKAGKQRNIEKLQDLIANTVSVSEGPTNGSYSEAQVETVISKVPLFRSLPQHEIQFLASALKQLDYKTDTILFLEGDRGDHFYVVIKGSVEIIKALGTADENTLAVRGSGEFIGEMSLLNLDGLRTASARAKGKTRLLEMTRSEFDELLVRQPYLAYELMRVLSERLNTSHNKALQEMHAKNEQLSAAYEALKAAQAQLIEQERMKRELELAYEIQMSILPDTLPETEGYDFGALIVPAREVGGDFFDVIQFNNDKVGILVGDVTDKGVPAAIFMAQTLALFRAVVKPSKSPSKTLIEINRHLLGMNRQNLFATVLYGILDRRSGKFSYARAGHELPLVYMPDGEIVIPEVGAGMPLGLFKRPLIDKQTILLPAGSLMVVYSDGVTDALVASEKRFGEDGLIAALRQTDAMSAQDVCDFIFRSLTSGDLDEQRVDDVTLVTVRSLGVET
jgi:serine phosphatase RsbU (regulator of sigma subunit)